MKALQTDHIDLYYQHRVDPKVPIEIVMQTLGELIDEGKIKWIGMSECSAETLRRAKAVKGVGEKVVAVQMEFGPFSLDIEKGDFLKVVEETGVAVVAYSPLNRGMVTGRYVVIYCHNGTIHLKSFKIVDSAPEPTSTPTTSASSSPVSAKKTSPRTSSSLKNSKLLLQRQASQLPKSPSHGFSLNIQTVCRPFLHVSRY